MPKDLRPLSETEQFQLDRLLDRSGQSLAEAQRERDRGRDREARLRARSDRLAAEEARLARRLAQLRVDLDVCTAELYRIAPSGTAFRFANEGLQKLAAIIPGQSYFNTSHDFMDRDALMLIGEIALSLHAQATKPRGKPLREKMAGVGEIGVGQDAPGGAAPNDRAALAAAIIKAGRRRRGEE